MIKIINTLLLYLMATTAFAMNLTSEVDRTSISINETVILTITLDRQGADDIDLSAVELQFDILQRRRSSQTSIINGKIASKTQWVVLLAPKETGTLIIPSLSSMGVYSEAISITVTNRNNSSQSNGANTKQNTNTNNKEDVFLEATIDKTSAYVQEQVLLTLRLYYRIPLSSYTDQPLNIDNASVELTAENNKKADVNGTTYNVLEKIYAIHPQASGTLTIPEQSWRAEKATQRFGFQGSNPYLRAKSQTLSVEVLPIPTASTANHWLPANKLSLTQQWQQSIITATVGEPLTYTLTMQADGLHYSQLPDITIPSTENFTVYSDQANTDNALSTTGIKGSRIAQYAVIPKAAGTYQVPAITLKWWNINTNQEETIELEAQNIIVANANIDEQLPENTSTIMDTLDQQAVLSPPSNTHWIWPLTTLLFALLSAIFFILWFKSYRSSIHPQTTTEKPLVKNTQQSLSQIYTTIEQAIDQQQWHELAPLLQQWASIKTEEKITTNSDIIHHFPQLKPLFDALDKQLYSKSSIAAWDKEVIIPLLKKQTISDTKNNKKQPLSQLYPN